jgi:hypothetical protein
VPNSDKKFFTKNYLFAKTFIEFEPDELSSFCFFLKLRSMPFMQRRFYTGRNNDKNVIFPQNCLLKNHSKGKEGSKMGPLA